MTDRKHTELVDNAPTLDDSTKELTNAIMTAAREHIPQKQIKIDPTKPWFKKPLLQLIRRKHAAAISSHRFPNDIQKKRRAKRLKKRVEKEVKKAIISYYKDLFDNCKTPKQFWDAIRKVTKGPRIHPLELEPDWLCDTDFVVREILKIPLSKAPGPDTIPSKLLHEAVEILAPTITSIINRCVEGKFLTDWKHAIVCPIPKVNGSTLPLDYRPISLLCLMAKIAEKWLLHLLLPYVDPKLSDTQFGFRQGRSTEDALAYFEKLVCDGFEKCKNATKVCTIFFDVKAAFDTVPLSRLLMCLENHYQVPSYLLSVLK